MYEEIKKIKGIPRDWENFAIVLGVLVILAAGVRFWKNASSEAIYGLFAGAGIVALGMVAPAVFRPWYRAWMALAVIVSWAMTRIFLAIAFFCVVTPLAAMMRILGKWFFPVAADHNAASYWERREVVADNRAHYERQF